MVLVVVLLLVLVLVLVTGVKQSQLLVLRLGLEFDNMYRGESNIQLQAEVQGVQGDGGQLDQVVGQDVVDRT